MDCETHRFARWNHGRPVQAMENLSTTSNKDLETQKGANQSWMRDGFVRNVSAPDRRRRLDHRAVYHRCPSGNRTRPCDIDGALAMTTERRRTAWMSAAGRGSAPACWNSEHLDADLLRRCSNIAALALLPPAGAAVCRRLSRVAMRSALRRRG